MTESRVLLGCFDLIHIGHLTQIQTVSDDAVELTVAVVSDRGVLELTGHQPFLPEAERAAVLEQMRLVTRTCIVGPENGWELPDHDSLYVDSIVIAELNSQQLDLRDAQSVRQTRVPANPALVQATSAA